MADAIVNGLKRAGIGLFWMVVLRYVLLVGWDFAVCTSFLLTELWMLAPLERPRRYTLHTYVGDTSTFPANPKKGDKFHWYGRNFVYDGKAWGQDKPEGV